MFLSRVRQERATKNSCQPLIVDVMREYVYLHERLNLMGSN